MDSIKKLLEYYGYTCSIEDEGLISLMRDRTADYIKNFCNISTPFPEELESLWTEMTVGEFLKIKMLTNPDMFEGLDFSADGVKSLTEGDVTISLNSGGEDSLTGRYRALIDRLCSRNGELIAFRKLRW